MKTFYIEIDEDNSEYYCIWERINSDCDRLASSQIPKFYAELFCHLLNSAYEKGFNEGTIFGYQDRR